MCVMSAVYDHYSPLFPDPGIWPQNPWPLPPVDPARPAEVVPPLQPAATAWPMFVPPGYTVIQQAEVERLQKLIADFREAVEAAGKIDRLTGQPDCVDLDKKALDERIAALEARLADEEQNRSRSRHENAVFALWLVVLAPLVAAQWVRDKVRSVLS